MRASAQGSLFALEPVVAEDIPLVQGDGDVRLLRNWLPARDADALLAGIRLRAIWIRERRKMYDRIVDVPREQAWFGDDRAHPWFPELLAVRAALECVSGARFNFVLVNRYRSGRDAVAWHNDHLAPGLRAPVIGSLTLGATRAFDLRPKSARAHVISVELEHGDLLIMRGTTQENWEHRVARDPRVAAERINLTFRQQPE